MTHLGVHGSPLCSLRWKCLASVSISSPSPHYSMLFALSLNTEAKDHTHAFPASFSPPTGGQSFKYFLYNRQPPKCQFRSPACALVRLTATHSKAMLTNTGAQSQWPQPGLPRSEIVLWPKATPKTPRLPTVWLLKVPGVSIWKQIVE